MLRPGRTTSPFCEGDIKAYAIPLKGGRKSIVSDHAQERNPAGLQTVHDRQRAISITSPKAPSTERGM